MLVAAIAVLVACGKPKEVKETPAPTVEKHDMKGMKIAYYNSDSLKVLFEYFKKEEQIVKKKESAFEQEVERRTRAYRSFIEVNNQKLQSGLLSENQQVQIQQTAERMQAELMQYQQNEGAKLQAEIGKKMETISKKIEGFGKQFCEKNKIDILLIHAAGGQINYINSSMDVTNEFAAFLNENEAAIDQSIKK